MSTISNKFYTTFEAAKVCHVSPGSINRWIHEGKLASATTAGGHHRIEGKQLAAFLQQLNLPIPQELEMDSLKCLLLSENKTFTRQLEGILRGWHPEILTDEAHDYFMAGWKASRFRPDLVVLDLGSCGAKALKVCELMRAFFEYKTTPFLVLSGEITKELKSKIQTLGASDWLLKPFVKKDFIKKLDQLLTADAMKVGA